MFGIIKRHLSIEQLIIQMILLPVPESHTNNKGIP